MKKVYETPVFQIERYQLNTSIASNCAIVVSNGPAMGSHQQCDDYDDPFFDPAEDDMAPFAMYNVQFYDDDHCDCYTTGGDSGYWTS